LEKKEKEKFLIKIILILSKSKIPRPFMRVRCARTDRPHPQSSPWFIFIVRSYSICYDLHYISRMCDDL